MFKEKQWKVDKKTLVELLRNGEGSFTNKVWNVLRRI